MTGASKILTVSYGTFSCTLEGFDDPLTTMKIIAEYFRDLAAGDRFFGSEPAIPDTAMLHRIAERESQRRVEASVQDDGGVHLRATEPAEHVDAFDQDFDADDESVAAIDAPMMLTTPILPVSAPTPAPAPVQASAFVTPASPTRIEGVAAKLMRIRASALSEGDTIDGFATEQAAPRPAADISEPSEAEPVSAPFVATTPVDDPISDWRLSESDGFMADDDSGDDDEPVEMAAADDDVDDYDEQLAETIKAAMSMSMSIEPLPIVEAAPVAPKAKPPVRNFSLYDDEDDDVEEKSGDNTASVPAPAPGAPVAERLSALGKLRLARARLIKVRKADVAEVEVAPAPTEPQTLGDALRQLPETADDTSFNRLIEQTNSEMDVPEQRARWSAIAHLKAAVATTVADRAARGGEDLPDNLTDAYKGEFEKIVHPEPSDTQLDPDQAPPLVLVSEQRIDRRIAEQADEPAPPLVRPRRVAVSNLALNSVMDAVEHDFAEEEDEDEDDTGDVSVFFDPLDFAEFAQRLGAEDMGDLIQAAGVYAALIECRPHFSPMHLIRQIITSTELGDFDREEGLRAFGVLLREGKIERVRKGQYIVTDESEYMIEAQRILG